MKRTYYLRDRLAAFIGRGKFLAPLSQANRKWAPDFEGFAVMKGVTTAFLDATTKGDAAAKEFVTKADISSLTGNRAKLSPKPPGESTAVARKN